MSSLKDKPYTLHVFNSLGARIDTLLCVDDGGQTEASLLANYSRRFPNAGASRVAIIERRAW